MIDGNVAKSQYLTFTLAGETFAIEVHKVRELLEVGSMTRMPSMPEHMQGVINLRSRVVPVVNMRKRLGFPNAENTVNTCIIVVAFETSEGLHLLGAMVDSVLEVLEMDPAMIESLPAIINRKYMNFISGIARHENKLLMIIDPEIVVSSNEGFWVPVESEEAA